MTVGELLGHLDGVKRTGDGWTARCPGHDDERASLSVSEGDQGRALLHCFAGCSFPRICAAMGIDPRELAGNRADGNGAVRRGSKRIVAMYEYRDETGGPLYRVVRTLAKGFYQQRPDGNGGWVNGSKGVRRVLYRLPELLAADDKAWHFVSEGEKDADNLHTLGVVATTNPSGAGKFGTVDSSPLHGRRVAILPDNDAAGRDHAQDVARLLHGKAAEVRIVALPGLPEKGDVSDWIAAGGTAEQLLASVEATPSWTPDGGSDQVPDGGTTADSPEPRPNSGADPHRPIAKRLVELAEGDELFHDADGAGYATFAVGRHRETHALRSRAYRQRLAGLLWHADGRAANAEAAQAALNTLEAKARFDGPEHAVHVRIAGHGESIYLDLGDSEWHCVEIDAAGWRLCENLPVKFRRPRGMLPLPIPELGGHLRELRNFVNVADDASFALLAAWMVGAMRGRGPFPVLILSGEQGSAKSTTARILRAMIDPNQAPLRSQPREERDLIIAAANSAVVALDNLSGIAASLSDALCRLATGGGFGSRELYSDGEEVIFANQRPVLLNGIDDIATRSDLLDRTIQLSLPTIPDEKRRAEDDLWREFERRRPMLLGALLTAVSAGLRNVGSVRLERLPRMADFAQWVIACESALPWQPGVFLRAYEANRAASHDAAVDGAPAVRALIEWARELPEPWEGATGQLLDLLRQRVDADTPRREGWPGKAQGFANQLRRLAPNLRHLGIDVESLPRAHGGRRRIRVTRKLGGAVVTGVTDVTEPGGMPPEPGSAGDIHGDNSADVGRGNVTEKPALRGSEPLGDKGDVLRGTFRGSGADFVESFSGWADPSDDAWATGA